MDLNMIQGLGPATRQTLYKNNISDVEKLLKILPTKSNFYEPINLKKVKKSKFITLNAQIITFPEDFNDKEMIKFSINCDGEVITAIAKKNNYSKKQNSPGKNIKIYGFYNIEEKTINIDQIFKEDDKNFNNVYEVADLSSSLIQNFAEKGLNILKEYSNEIPLYIRTKLGISSYSSILKDIHMPNNSETFMNAIKNYTYEIFFNYFVKFYYYIVSTSLSRGDEVNFESLKINAVINEYKQLIDDSKKKYLNEIINTYKKSIFSNVLLEKFAEEDKMLAVITAIVAKVSIKKQVIIVVKENFDFYVKLKEELTKFNIKMDFMARKGRNKENFDNFNIGKHDVLIALPVNFDKLACENIGLIICDQENFDITTRYSVNCNNCDTLFITNTNFEKNISQNILKNITILNPISNKENYLNVIFDNILVEENNKIIKKLLTKEQIESIVDMSSNDAFDFIKNKKFKDSKENYEYLKKIMQNTNLSVKK